MGAAGPQTPRLPLLGAVDPQTLPTLLTVDFRGTGGRGRAGASGTSAGIWEAAPAQQRVPGGPLRIRRWV